MDLREVIRKYKQFKVPSLSEIQEKASQHSKTSLVIIIILVVFLLLALQYIPHYQVAQFNITNQKDLADAENSYRATLAQIFGGVAIAIGIYYTWRRITIAEEDLKATQKNLEVIQEGQITERFTRAVEQLGAIDNLGNPAIEIRLGGIYALERIANESEKDYWPIMEILTAYVRKNSSVGGVGNKTITQMFMDAQANEDTENEVSKVSEIPLDIQAILNVIRERKYSYYTGENKCLDLHKTNLCKADLAEAHFENTNFYEANLRDVDFQRANLKGAYLESADLCKATMYNVFLHEANLQWAKLNGANLIKAVLTNSNLQEADLQDAFLSMANLESADLGIVEEDSILESIDWFEGANLENAHLEEANFRKANLKRANLKGVFIKDTNFEQANIEGANFEGTYLKGAKNLTVDQLSKVKTLYKAQLDIELEAELRKRGFDYLLDNKPKR